MGPLKNIRDIIINSTLFIFDWDGVFVKDGNVNSLVVSQLFNNEQIISSSERDTVIKNLLEKFEVTVSSRRFSFNELSFQKIFEPNFYQGISQLGLPDRHDIYPLFAKECLLKIYPAYNDSIQLFNKLKEIGKISIIVSNSSVVKLFVTLRDLIFKQNILKADLRHDVFATDTHILNNDPIYQKLKIEMKSYGAEILAQALEEKKPAKAALPREFQFLAKKVGNIVVLGDSVSDIEFANQINATFLGIHRENQQKKIAFQKLDQDFLLLSDTSQIIRLFHSPSKKFKTLTVISPRKTDRTFAPKFKFTKDEKLKQREKRYVKYPELFKPNFINKPKAIDVGKICQIDNLRKVKRVILELYADGLGCTVLGLPTLIALRQNFPGTQINICGVPHFSKSLIAPWVNGYTYKSRIAKKKSGLYCNKDGVVTLVVNQKYSGWKNYHLASNWIDLAPSFPPNLARLHAHEIIFKGMDEYKDMFSISEEAARVLIPFISQDFVSDYVEHSNILKDGFIVLTIKSGKQIKDLTSEQYIDFIDMFIGQTKLSVALCVGESHGDAESIIKRSKYPSKILIVNHVWGSNSKDVASCFQEQIALFNQSKLVITLDTGLLYVMNALYGGPPILAIFTATPATIAMPGHAKDRAVQAKYPYQRQLCGQCWIKNILNFKDQCLIPNKSTPGECGRFISVAEIVKVAVKMV